MLCIDEEKLPAEPKLPEETEDGKGNQITTYYTYEKKFSGYYEVLKNLPGFESEKFQFFNILNRKKLVK